MLLFGRYFFLLSRPHFFCGSGVILRFALVCHVVWLARLAPISCKVGACLQVLRASWWIARHLEIVHRVVVVQVHSVVAMRYGYAYLCLWRLAKEFGGRGLA